jgi:3-oxoacyl-[acyl-carrier protein] reductase
LGKKKHRFLRKTYNPKHKKGNLKVILDLSGQVAFVAGSSRGIGRSIAEQLLAEDCRVCLSGRDEISLQSTSNELEKQFDPDRILSISADLTDPAAVQRSIKTIVDQWGKLDILVANLGTGKGKPGWDIEEEEWQRLFQLNFYGSVRLAKEAITVMAKQSKGCIIFISSITGVEATAAPLPYGAAKAALINYSKNLARSVAGLGIRVNCVAPGNILFPGGSWDQHLATKKEATEQYIATEVPLKRFGTPDEIASLVAFLCSSQSAFTTGACHIIDGGQTRSV